MKLADKRIVLTGATGGIGSRLAHEFDRRGARLVLVGRSADRLGALAAGLRRAGGAPAVVVADLSRPEAARRVAGQAQAALGGIDILVNNAGQGRFALFEDDDPAAIDALLMLDLAAPMRLAHALLPQMLERGSGAIVNIGSTFGRLGFPGYGAYSAAKHGLRGWSESLRRELSDSGVDVVYVSPRATETALNDARAVELNRMMKTTVDRPEVVARQIVRAIERQRPESQLGWPEKLVVRLNAVCPGMLDRALAARLALVRRCAQAAVDPGPRA